MVVPGAPRAGGVPADRVPAAFGAACARDPGDQRGREVHNRVIETARPYSAAELEQAANFLNRTYAGQYLEAVRRALLVELNQTRESLDAIMRRAVEMAGQVFEGSSGRDALLVAGQSNLMDFNELQHMERLRQLGYM